MLSFDKDEIKEMLTDDLVFSLLEEFGGEPEYADNGIIAKTICHNHPSQPASRKLYYYSNSKLFQCYSNCGSFDIFELVIKIMQIQQGAEYDLNDAVRFIAFKFGLLIAADQGPQIDNQKDWDILENYKRLKQLEVKDYNITLPEYNDNVLHNLNYSVKITPWLNEDMSQEALDLAQIGYYPSGQQISIPHFDQNGRFIGLRGRALSQEDAERFGKYRPIRINGTTYNHPTGMNLYGLNWAKDNIKNIGKAIVFESEKSVLKYMTAFGINNNIAVACCGSNLSVYQVQMLIAAGAKEIIIAFDKQFQKLGNEEFNQWVSKLRKIQQRFKNYVLISIMFDKYNLLGYKSSPIDEGTEKFLKLFKNRILL